jgi:excisionase family DNA binding protein
MSHSHINDDDDKLRGLTGSAKRWGIGRSTLNELLRRGEIAYVRLPGGERRVADSSMRDWIARTSVRSTDAA